MQEGENLTHGKQSMQALEALEKARTIQIELQASDTSALGKLILSTEKHLDALNPSQFTEDEIEDLELDADDLLERGNIEEGESFYDQAMELYNQALDIYTQIGKVSGIIKTNLMIGKFTLLKVSMGLPKIDTNVVFVFQRNTTYFYFTPIHYDF